MSRLKDFKANTKRKIRRGAWKRIKKYARLYLELRILKYGIRSIGRRIRGGSKPEE